MVSVKSFVAETTEFFEFLLKKMFKAFLKNRKMVYVCRKDNNACHVTYRESSPVLSPLGRLFI